VKTVTLTAWNRPDYLRRTVDALSKADTRGYALVAVLDYEFDPECYRIIHGIGFMPKHIITLGTSYGVDFISKHAIETALRFGSTLNVALEDDTLVAPDCLNLVNWWSEQKISGETVLTCFTFSQDRKNHQEVVLTDDFHSSVWCAKSELLRWLLTRWCEIPGWDTSLRNTLRVSGIKCVAPRLSRAANIGEVGIHYNPELFAQHFHGCQMSDGLVRQYFLNT
jgi:hypothetical protein